MQRRLFAAFLTLAVLAITTAADDFDSPEWKDEVAHGFLPYRKLTYDDFPETQGVPTPHVMQTQGFFHYTFKARWVQENDTFAAKVIEFNVRSGFDQNKSWRQTTFTQTKALLSHEQGHLDINELHAEELRHAPLPEGSGSSGEAAMDDLKGKLKTLCEKCNRESQLEQDAYDTETNHGAIADQQEVWNRALRKRLDFFHITYWDQSH